LANVTPQPPYPRGNRLSTHYAECRVGPKAGLGKCGKSRLNWDSIPGPSNPQRIAIPTELTWPLYFGVYGAAKLTAVLLRPLNKRKEALPRNPGMKQRQLVIMAPFTTSRVGSIMNTRSPVPIVLRVSAMNTTKNCSRVGLVTFLKKQIRVERRNDNTSGIAKAKNKHHIQPTRSSSSSIA